MVARKKKAGPLTKEETDLFIKDLTEKFFAGELIKKTPYQWSKVFNVALPTMYKLLDKMYEQLPEINVEKNVKKFDNSFDMLEQKLLTQLEIAEDPSIIDRLINTYMKLMKEKTEILERWFEKDTVVNKVEISGEIKHSAIMINYQRELDMLKNIDEKIIDIEDPIEKQKVILETVKTTEVIESD